MERIKKQKKFRRKPLSAQPLRVTTKEDKPFVFNEKKDENNEPLTDLASWNGFCIDLLKEISSDLRQNFTIHPVKDNQYGSIVGKKDGKNIWNGMINELIKGERDLAVAAMTISYDREMVIDFTTPFMSIGLTILFKRPRNESPGLFSFLTPLSVPIWGLIIAAILLVSTLLYIISHMHPPNPATPSHLDIDWSVHRTNAITCSCADFSCNNPRPAELEGIQADPAVDTVVMRDRLIARNPFTFFNCVWFIMGGALQQGSEVAPRSSSTRLLTGFWWFFSLIIISSYTANLAAFLTVERVRLPIKNVEELANQTKIKYGTLRSGASMEFFKNALIKTYQRMWLFMDANPDVFTAETTEGVKRVEKGNYAYLMESSWNEYYVRRNCDLMRIGDPLDSKGYGIGFPQGSKYRDSISESILKLQKNQVLHRLKRKWLQQYNVSEPCDKKANKSKTPKSLGVDQVGGVFIMLLVGLSLALLTAILEFLYALYRQRHPHHTQQTHARHANITNNSASIARHKMAMQTKLTATHSERAKPQTACALLKQELGHSMRCVIGSSSPVLSADIRRNSNVGRAVASQRDEAERHAGEQHAQPSPRHSFASPAMSVCHSVSRVPPPASAIESRVDSRNNSMNASPIRLASQVGRRQTGHV